MKWFKITLLVPILWFSIVKIDKQGFYQSYFKILENLHKKNSITNKTAVFSQNSESVEFVNILQIQEVEAKNYQPDYAQIKESISVKGNNFVVSLSNVFSCIFINAPPLQV